MLLHSFTCLWCGALYVSFLYQIFIIIIILIIITTIIVSSLLLLYMFNLISMFRHEVAVTSTTFRVRNTFSIIWYTVSVCCLTHWGRVTHICVRKLTIIGSDNGLSPGRRQAIIWTNAGLLLIRPWGTNFSEIFIGNQISSFKKMHLKMSSAKWRPFVSASMC